MATTEQGVDPGGVVAGTPSPPTSVRVLVELLVAIELQTGQSGRHGAAVINEV
ncbi:hypothetical protein [Nocardia sp. NPDC058497]|uniref:hypothetical protein n=1 Tax=Nocardia sp. NPDC058497 TaxID=3346529 RepID=UPI00365ED0F2